MKLTIERKSWHYKLATFGWLDVDYDDQTDLCRYFWALVRGAGRVPFFILVGAGVLWVLVLNLLVMLAVFISTGIFHVTTASEVGLAVWLVGALMGGMFYVIETGKEVPGARLITAGYRGWKEKTCVIVDLK